MPGRRDDFGEWVPGGTEDSELRASVQPLALADADLEGGSQLHHRLKVYVLPRREVVAAATATLRLRGLELTLRGAPLTLNAGAEIMDRHALAAALAEAGADKVIIEGTVFVVEETRTWRRFTRATLLRET